MIHKKGVRGLLLNRESDAVAVLPPEEKRLQDQQVKRALQERYPLLLLVCFSRHATGVCACSGSQSTKATAVMPSLWVGGVGSSQEWPRPPARRDPSALDATPAGFGAPSNFWFPRG